MCCFWKMALFNGMISPPGPEKAIYAIREVVQNGAVYQTKGMACAVKKQGSVFLTSSAVVKNSDSLKPSVIMDRFSEKRLGKQRFKSPTIKECDKFSFLSVNEASGKDGRKLGLDVQIPEKRLFTSDIEAHSFCGKKPFEIKFKYSKNNKRHELVVDGIEEKLGNILEKNYVLGSPIIVKNADQTRKNGPYSIVGVVGFNDEGELCPSFITQNLIDQMDSANLNNEGTPSEDDESFDLSGYSPIPPSDEKEGKRVKLPVVTGQKSSTPEASGSHTDIHPGRDEHDAPGPIQVSSDEISPGNVPLEWLPYIAADIQASPLKKWKFLGSSLQLSKADLNGIESDNDEEYERCYKMLAKWYKQSSAPSFKDLADALEEEKLYEIRENYCVLGHDPPTQKIVQHVGNLKPGRVDQADLLAIASEVQEERKRFGRALGVKDNDLHRIEQENPENIAEQSYKILTEWNQGRIGKDASYYAIAQALCDRTVKRPGLVSKFCVRKDS